MSDTYKCVKCSHTREGRFTRLNSGRSGSWTKSSLPAWWCFICLPLGQGRGEDGQQPADGSTGPHDATKQSSTPKRGRLHSPKGAAGKGVLDPFGSKAAAQSASVEQGERAATEEPAKGEALAPAQQKTQGLVVAQVVSLKVEADELTITDDKSYEYADALLGRARNAVKIWEPIWERIQDRTIKPQRQALESLYELNRDIEGPSLKIQQTLKEKMKVYKLAEARRIQKEQDDRDKEAARLIEEAKLKEKAIEEAKTPAMRERLRTALDDLTKKTEVVLMTAPSPKVMGFSSGTRKVKKARVGNWEEFATFLLDDGGDIVMRDTFLRAIDEMINSRYRTDKTIEGVYGIEVYDDLDIVGRG